MKLTVERLHELIHYDPSTGVFRWRVRRGGQRAGDVAGGLASNGYWRLYVEGRMYQGQRLAFFYMTGEWPASLAEHKDTDKLNNRWDNLREAEKAENGYNRGKNKNNKSGYKGVCWSKGKSKWMAQIVVNGKYKFLGYHDTPEWAHAAYTKAAIEFHGAFARVE